MSSLATNPGGREVGIRSAARRISEHAAALGRLEAELVKAELSAKGKLLGVAAGLGAGAVILAILALAFALAGGAAALALVLPLWAALLIVAAIVAMAGGIVALAAVRSARKASPPVPQQAIDEAQATRIALSSNGR